MLLVSNLHQSAGIWNRSTSIRWFNNKKPFYKKNYKTYWNKREKPSNKHHFNALWNNQETISSLNTSLWRIHTLQSLWKRPLKGFCWFLLTLNTALHGQHQRNKLSEGLDKTRRQWTKHYYYYFGQLKTVTFETKISTTFWFIMIYLYSISIHFFFHLLQHAFVQFSLSYKSIRICFRDKYIFIIICIF